MTLEDFINKCETNFDIKSLSFRHINMLFAAEDVDGIQDLKNMPDEGFKSYIDMLETFFICSGASNLETAYLSLDTPVDVDGYRFIAVVSYDRQVQKKEPGRINMELVPYNFMSGEFCHEDRMSKMDKNHKYAAVYHKWLHLINDVVQGLSKKKGIEDLLKALKGSVKGGLPDNVEMHAVNDIDELIELLGKKENKEKKDKKNPLNDLTKNITLN